MARRCASTVRKNEVMGVESPEVRCQLDRGHIGWHQDRPGWIPIFRSLFVWGEEHVVWRMG